MIRLSSISEQDPKTARLALFLSLIASRTIYEALCKWCPDEAAVNEIFEIYFSRLDEDDLWDEEDDLAEYFLDDEREGFLDDMDSLLEKGDWDDLELGDDEEDWYDDDEEELFSEGFFDGIGQFYSQNGEPLSDEAAGKEILWRKIGRMKEKALDAEQYYTFDIVEEILLTVMIDALKVDELMEGALSGDLPENVIRIVNADIQSPLTEEEQRTADVLVRAFRVKPEAAESIAMQVHRITAMDLYDAEDTPAGSLIFWDDDADILFEDGFVAGILRCADETGDMLGYGYDYTCRIFTDIGMKPPVRLIGTREGNAERNKARSGLERKWDPEGPFT